MPDHVLDPQDSASAAKYSYHATVPADAGHVVAYSVASHFEGPGAIYGPFSTRLNRTWAESAPPSPMQRWACDNRTTLQFAMPVSGWRSGAILRRTFDYFYAPQAAELSVNGRAVGLWHTADHNPNFRLREDDFLLPPEVLGPGPDVRLELRLVCLKGHSHMVWTHGTYSLLRVMP